MGNRAPAQLAASMFNRWCLHPTWPLVAQTIPLTSRASWTTWMTPSEPYKSSSILTRKRPRSCAVKRRLWRVCWPWSSRTRARLSPTSFTALRRKSSATITTRRPKAPAFNSKSLSLRTIRPHLRRTSSEYRNVLRSWSSRSATMTVLEEFGDFILRSWVAFLASLWCIITVVVNLYVTRACLEGSHISPQTWWQRLTRRAGDDMIEIWVYFTFTIFIDTNNTCTI